MKEIVVISGKGGTGKTSITASFAILGGKNIVVADCDVDAADMHLLLQPDWNFSEDFFSGVAAEIDQDKCIKCGKCADVCRFNAIPIVEKKYVVNDLNCEGCGFCFHVCPRDAISMIEQNVGKWFISNTKAENHMVHAALKIGADNSGKLVAKVKKEAKQIAVSEEKAFIIVDGSPGIGCPVVSSLSGADYAILVTEPSVSGIHDLKRVYELVKKFKIPAACIINKADINTDVTAQIKAFLDEENIIHLVDLPYDETFTKAMTAGKTIIEFGESEMKKLVENSWRKIKELLTDKQKRSSPS
ncbi:MAG: ATP-binding protein [Candidatus Cloacimonetes bacterium]|nr:ATP-binding protein [Candidatus Cloacimonadota bacterium]MCF7813888.1 ATP-binding protein [Candidatus Cloacimonadota bacterium]MCF7868901.1 ATP-binding protein [Candidatus Cloacimonadota bacterium]MCF7884000.1 ATP-binding protein [Candidatus Cloacimonadota bacterium]